MRAIVRRAMAEGAWGLTTGLEYTPGTYASTEELVVMAKVVAEFGGVYMSHQRNEFDGVLESTRETIRIGRESGIRVLTSHFKACGKNNWGSLREAVVAINAARARGIQVFADQYPYDKPSVEPLISIRSNRGWSCFRVPDDLEPFASLRREMRNRDLAAADREALRKRYVGELTRALATPDTRARIREAVLVGNGDYRSAVSRAGWDSYGIVYSRTHPDWTGQVLSDLAREANRHPFDLAAELAIEEPDMILTSGVMSPDDVRHAMRQSWLMISSDGDA